MSVVRAANLIFDDHPMLCLVRVICSPCQNVSAEWPDPMLNYLNF